MSDGPKGKYFSEAHRFESYCGFLLNHLGVPNDLESTKATARAVLRTCISALFHQYIESLKARREMVTKEKWLKVGRPTLEKMRADMKKFHAEKFKAVNRNVWRG